jgi:hypothetical protein
MPHGRVPRRRDSRRRPCPRSGHGRSHRVRRRGARRSSCPAGRATRPAGEEPAERRAPAAGAPRPARTSPALRRASITATASGAPRKAAVAHEPAAVKRLERIEDTRRQLALRRGAEQREEIAVVRSLHRPGASGQNHRAHRAARPRATALRLHDPTSAARERVGSRSGPRVDRVNGGLPCCLSVSWTR